jgi:hypothetical protein
MSLYTYEPPLSTASRTLGLQSPPRQDCHATPRPAWSGKPGGFRVHGGSPSRANLGTGRNGFSHVCTAPGVAGTRFEDRLPETKEGAAVVFTPGLGRTRSRSCERESEDGQAGVASINRRQRNTPSSALSAPDAGWESRRPAPGRSAFARGGGVRPSGALRPERPSWPPSRRSRGSGSCNRDRAALPSRPSSG